MQPLPEGGYCMLLDRDLRIAVLELARAGHTRRAIARALKISRGAVGRVLESQQKEVPSLERGSWLDEHRETIEGLFVLCDGNLVRVHEELEKKLAERSASKRFCPSAGSKPLV